MHSLLAIPSILALLTQAPEPRRTDGAIEIKGALVKLIAQVEVPAQEAGVLTAIDAKEGQTVEVGGLLARIDDDNVRVKRDQAELERKLATIEAENEAELQAATREVAVAEADLKRAQRSKERRADSVSPAEMDHLELTVTLAQLKVQRAKHAREQALVRKQLRDKDVEQADTGVKRRRIASPLAGVVVEVYRRVGEWVEPGDKVVRVVRLDSLRVEGFLDVQQARQTPVGAPVVLRVETPGAPEQRFPGQIVFVSPEVDPVNRQTRVWAEIENRGRQLYPGLRATLAIAPRP